jgi:zinc transporter
VSGRADRAERRNGTTVMAGQDALLQAGVEPGLRFAAVLDGAGGCTDLDWRGVSDRRPTAGCLWIHLERDAPEAQDWVQHRAGIDPVFAEALLAEDSRPRVEPCDNALLIILRGINLCERESVELVPIHLWVEAWRIISLRDADHALSALRDIRIALQSGRGPRGVGGLLVQISEKIVRDLEDVLDEMDGKVERLEEEVMARVSVTLRQELADLRLRAIHLRRYLGPQREALVRLHGEETTLLDRRDRLRLRSVIDRVIRFIEDLDAIRDRTTVLHQDLAAQITERIAQTSNRLTAVAALLLPPSLVAAMLGANVGGIPGHDDPIAFLEMSAIMLVLMALQWLILRRLGWL